MTKNKTLAFIERSISEVLNDYFKSFLSRLVNIRDLNSDDGKSLRRSRQDLVESKA